MSSSQSPGPSHPPAHPETGLAVEEVDALPEMPTDTSGMTPEQKDAHWFKYFYKGDQMPQLTLRAVMMGGLLGMAMSAANLYTTLKIGWSFGVAITACVMSFAIWNAFRALSGGALSKMSILENNCMQSTASAAGYSTGSTIATMFGALLLMQANPEGGTSADVKTLAVQPWVGVTIFTFCTGMMGVFLAIPMKRQMINHEQLPFPSGIAAAETLKSLYSESREAVLKAYSLIIALFVSAFIGILNTGEGTLKIIDKLFGEHGALKFMHLPEQVPADGFATITPAGGKLHGFWEKIPGAKQLIQFGFEPSVLLIAAGMIVGLRVSLTMLAGSILLYFFVAPPLIAADAAHLLPDGKYAAGFVPSIELVAGGTTFHIYRWALWGGTSLMVMSSLTALAFQWKTMGKAITGALSGRKEEVGETAAMKAIEVPFWWMLAGMIPLTIAMVLLQVISFQIAWWAGIIAVAMSFVLSLVACRATGETDTTPIGAMGKVMQITFAILHPGNATINLASAGIAANSASSSADLLTDLKSGYLLGANPRRQFIAQFFGVFFGTVAIIPLWYLMVPTKAVLESYPAPGTNQWFRVAQVLTQGLDSLAYSAKVSIALGGILGIILPCIEKFFIPAKLRPFWPSTMGLGLSWVVGFNNSLAFAIGAVITYVWTLIHRKSADTFNIPIASGLVAGESLMKALIAVLATLSGIFAWGL
ncbi:MAG: OPT family oligopeptide transporter [Phycisphaerales bacterium]